MKAQETIERIALEESLEAIDWQLVEAFYQEYEADMRSYEANLGR